MKTIFKYLAKRSILLLSIIVIIFITVFFLLQLMPGYPAALEKGIEQAKTTEEIDVYSRIIEEYKNENNSIYGFFSYVKKMFQGDFGKHYGSSKTIPQIFFEPLKYTLMISGPAFLIGTACGIICGFISGYKRGKWQDITVNVVATFFVSIPSFVLATFFLIFGEKVGLHTSFKDAQEIGEALSAVILPIAIISITSFSTLTYYIRNEVVEVLTSDFVSVARAKGLSETRIFFKHILKNVSLPFIAIVFPSFLGIIFGSFIIEIFFDVPGSAKVFSLAVINREKNVILFSTIFFTSFGLLIQIFMDILYVILDPRITLGNNFAVKNSWIQKLKKIVLRKAQKWQKINSRI